MIKNLRFRFIKIMMLSLFAVLFIIIGAMNIAYNLRNQIIADEKLKLLTVFGGIMPDYDDYNKMKPPVQKDNPGFRMNPETPFVSRYFSVLYENGEKVFVDISHIASLSEIEAMEYAEKIYTSGKENGSYKNYRYLSVNNETGTLIVFLDYSEEKNDSTTLLVTSVIISVIGYIAVLVLVTIISGRVIQPIIKNIERQKRFISDAGHEIKTPLAIIAANAEVLEITCSDNREADEWLRSIKHQIERLNALVHSMLRLSKMDEEGLILKEEEFSLSEAVESSVISFSALAKADNKNLKLDVTDGIFIKGDENTIRELVTILTDNAVKYSSNDSEISIKLERRGKNSIMEFCNRADNINIANIDKLFERFYREDASRSSDKTGYGLGLSIAKSIVEAHKGSITVECPEADIIKFTVII